MVALAMLGIIACLGSCRTVQPLIGPAEPVSEHEAGERLAALAEEVVSFQADFRVVFHGEPGRPPARGCICLLLPDYLRAEIVDPFGRVAMIASLTPDSAVALDMESNVLYEADEGRILMSELLGMETLLMDQLGLLIGITGFNPSTDKIVRIQEESADRRTIPDAGKRILYLSDDGERVVRCTVAPPDRTSPVEFSYRNFRESDKLSVPAEVSLIDIENDREIEIKYSRVTMNRVLGREFFEIEIPNGVRRVHLP